MKTVSGRMSRIAMPGCRSMYASARSAVSSAGSGTTSSIVTVWLGLVPHDTCGRRSAASSATSLSKAAPSSVGSDRQSSSACSQSGPLGAFGRPSRYANVVSSGATMPARAPASIDMLQTVIRPSIESERIADPRYSTT